MTHPTFHAESSVRHFGGRVEDYQPIHEWLDVIWTVRRGKSELHQAQSGAEGIRSSGSSEGMTLEGI